MNPACLPPGVALVALGSNLGNPHAAIIRALTQLRSMGPDGFRASSLWLTTPVDCPPDSPSFVNAAAVFRPVGIRQPEDMLWRLKDMEAAFGRGAKTRVNEPRPLDLDLIGFGTEVRVSPGLTLPHPRAHTRGFVLAPICELLPGLQLPGWGANAKDLLAGLPRTQEVLQRICPADQP